MTELHINLVSGVTKTREILNVLDEFGIEKRKTHEFGLIQIHHEQFVGWCQVGFF